MTTTNRFLRILAFSRHFRRTRNTTNKVVLNELGNSRIGITESESKTTTGSLQALMYSKENEMLFI